MIAFYKKYYCTTALCLLVCLFLISCSPDVSMVKEGDIVFQNLPTAENQIIQTLTHSDWNQCGIVLRDSIGNLIVIETTRQVKEAPLKKWVSGGEQKKFAVFRIKNSENILTKGILSKMKKITSAYIGKNEDNKLSWSDEEVYNSELVYKIYFLTTGIKLAETKPLKDFDWNNNEVKQKLQEIYKGKIPMNEPVISSQQLITSSWLVKIYTN